MMFYLVSYSWHNEECNEDLFEEQKDLFQGLFRNKEDARAFIINKRKADKLKSANRKYENYLEFKSRGYLVGEDEYFKDYAEFDNKFRWHMECYCDYETMVKTYEIIPIQIGR